MIVEMSQFILYKCHSIWNTHITWEFLKGLWVCVCTSDEFAPTQGCIRRNLCTSMVSMDTVAVIVFVSVAGERLNTYLLTWATEWFGSMSLWMCVCVCEWDNWVAREESM